LFAFFSISHFTLSFFVFLCPSFVFLPFLCALGGTQAVITWISEAVTLTGEDKDRSLQGWLAVLVDSVHPIDIEGHQGFTKIRHKMSVILSGSNCMVLTCYLHYLIT
jgi:hypothetical protein